MHFVERCHEMPKRPDAFHEYEAVLCNEAPDLAQKRRCRRRRQCMMCVSGTHRFLVLVVRRGTSFSTHTHPRSRMQTRNIQRDTNKERHEDTLNIIRRCRYATPSVCCNIGALIIRIGFCGPLYYNYNKEPPK